MYWVAMYDVQWEWDDKLKPTSKSITCEYIRIVLRFINDSKLKPTINSIMCDYITTEERFINISEQLKG